MYDYLDLRQTERLKELVPYKALAPDADEIIKELDRLNNIINQIKEYLKYQVENLDFEKDTKAKMLGSMILVMLDKEELKENKC